ncbi:MAG: hypothetical protein II056_00355, partial [Paludibacteraceae bacterium]|nr:hypothetical protein [Paludibacteraceae bacterium]
MRRLFTLIVTFCSVAAFAVSPYINKVYEFVPAPGQFINTMPAYTEGDTEATMLEKVDNALKGKAPATMICLGAFGGYVTVGFDHPIVNVKGQKDFLVYGNAFAGNAEPGVIMVMQDENGNGLPDDTWYEIAGSEYGNKSTRFNYEITYYKPSAEDDAATIAIDEYIRWTDNLGGEGFIPKNTFYSQPYYPQWITAESYTLRGTLLPKNARKNGNIWILDSFAYGYVDNVKNDSDDAKIDISWAVKADGTPANLESIDFIRIHTGENQVCGNIGETSTEVVGAEDLHPEASAVEEAEAVSFVLNPFSNEIVLVAAHPCLAAVYDLCGKCRLNATLTEGTNRIPASDLGKGTYILRTDNKSYK